MNAATSPAFEPGRKHERDGVPALNRTELQRLAEERILEAKILLDAGKGSGAYYLAGYAVECALKACIAKKTQAEDFPEKKVVQDSWTHDIMSLVKTAGIEAEWNADCDANVDLKDNWLIAKGWRESSRYSFTAEADARVLYNAIVDPMRGVLRWIKSRW